jgi:hypothetical protein
MKKILILSVVILGFWACENTEAPDYDRAAMLLNWSENIILPNYEALKVQTANLKTQTSTFLSVPNITNLQNLQSAWFNAVTAWKRCEMFNIAYAETIMLDNQIDSWSTNPAVIEQEIAGANPIDDTFIENTGTTRKGFPAFEYLIFGDNLNESEILTKYSSAENAARRKQYLQSLANHLDKKAGEVLTYWQNPANRQAFQNSTSIDLTSSTNVLVNELIVNLEVVINNKIGVPLGKKNNGIVQPNSVEALYSGASVNHILRNVETIEAVFLGKTGAGLDDNLDFVGAKFENILLSQAIKNQFTEIYQKINLLDSQTLREAVLNNPAQVEAIHVYLKKLLVLIKVDLTSQIGITITISDNDGD